ncbi:hypothetical protein [Oenococcus oeni]|uniref:hypothetical protein n=2 Tax=Oenococcus oeni TaxID=1247 RepID=UPI0004DB19C4|nr:hypothetical protein [Oenococcus oeni]KGH99301.1 hypothetical protein X283_01690 [Oenococcus oeni IOEB_1491]KGI03838.1 hypothetical protein X298_01965 [Oenococcus oeni IOEB_L65_2]KEK01957.1 hypothetical protein HL43_02060 [Oenococcus oeni]KER93199.1 hypothetical protein HR58_05025 [Oenococcus oeni]KER94384.1 hypothetical protein HT63_05595 [Oenococcus oeni]
MKNSNKLVNMNKPIIFSLGKFTMNSKNIIGYSMTGMIVDVFTTKKQKQTINNYEMVIIF